MLTSVPAGFCSFAGKTTSASVGSTSRFSWFGLYGCGGGCSGSGPGPGGGGGGGGPGGPGGRTSPSGLSTLTRMLISGLATATAASMASTIRKRIFCLVCLHTARCTRLLLRLEWLQSIR
uniref:Uncharacterized protein n=1 Tax=Anopheles melas TaxID=34690 RepID=A0A182THX0_9DIPT